MKRTKAEAKQAAIAQAWLPIDKLEDGFLHRVDGKVIGGIRIAPLCLDLRSQVEVRHLISGYQRVIASITVPFQTLSVPKPVDLEWHLMLLAEQAQHFGGLRRQLAINYQGWLANQVHSGASIERWFALLCCFDDTRQISAHRHLLATMVRDLHDAGIDATALDFDDWRELCWLMFHGRRAASEHPPSLAGIGVPRLVDPSATAEEGEGTAAPEMQRDPTTTKEVGRGDPAAISA